MRVNRDDLNAIYRIKLDNEDSYSERCIINSKNGWE